MDKDLKRLNELKANLSRLLEDCQKLAPFSSRVTGEVPKAEPIVIVLNGKNLLACYRRNKPIDSIEAIRVTKIDAEDGPTIKRFDMYLNRLARFMERKGMYPKRDIIKTETDSLFEKEGML